MDSAQDPVESAFEKILVQRKAQLKNIMLELNKDESNPNYFTKYVRKRKFETPEHLNYIGLDCGRRCFAFEVGNFNSLPTEHLCFLRCFSKHLNTMEIVNKAAEETEKPELYAQNL